MNAPTIRLIEGLHLTATNRAHMAALIGQGRLTGATKALAYTLEPIAGEARRYRFTIRKAERDDWGRPAPRYSRGIIEAGPIPAA